MKVHVKQEDDQDEEERTEITTELAKALGKKQWEIEKVQKEEERFFKANRESF